jgi:WD40 repeat protein
MTMHFPKSGFFLTFFAVACVLGCSRTARDIGSWADQGGKNKANVFPVVVTLNEDRGFLYDFSLSPDGKVLACSNLDSKRKGITVWDPAGGKQVASLTLERSCYTLCFSPDSRTLLCDEVNDRLDFFDTKTWKRRKSAQSPLRDVSKLAYSPDGRLLAIGNERMIILSDAASEKLLFSLKARLFSLPLHGLAFSPDSRILISGGMDGPIVGWSTATGDELWSFQSHVVPASDRIIVESIAVAPDGRSFSTGGRDRMVRTWDLATRKEMRALHDCKDEVTCVTYSPDGRILAASCGMGHTRGEVHFWDARTGEHLSQQEAAFLYGIVKIQFFPDGAKLAVGSNFRQPSSPVEIWDVSALRKRP